MFARTLGLSLLTAAAIFSATATHAAIIGTSGLTIISPPKKVNMNFVINQQLPHELVFDEQQNFTLSSAVNVDVGAGPIAAGTVVDSYFVAFDATRTRVTASLTFSTAVLGIEIHIASLGLTDFLGATGTVYSEASCGTCGFESNDTAVIAGDTVSVDFSSITSTPGDYARIITAGDVHHLEPPGQVPEPAALALLGAALAAAGFARYRVARRR
jgi:PEP-CTERM motif